MANLHVKPTIRRLLPRWLLNFYHWLWAILGNIIYGFPSRRLIVVGVTGTQGKSTVAAMICHALNKLGQSGGLISTATIKIGAQEWFNNLKMTMPGHTRLQHYLRQMVAAGQRYAVIETSSEALAQWRHWGIAYDAAIFTNLTPEHIESHGSFINYKQAKLKLWQSLIRAPKKIISHGVPVPKVSIVNGDDQWAGDFLSWPADKKYVYGLHFTPANQDCQAIIGHQVKAGSRAISFTVDKVNFSLPIGGEFNVYNALAAVAYLLSQNFALTEINSALSSFAGAPGRLEFIEAGQSWQLVVDYAHTPESLAAVYKTLTTANRQGGRLIAVLGSCGGGRDKAKRPLLGQLAGQYAAIVIVTNEDPYDEDPQAIMQAVAEGALELGKQLNKNLFIISDRRAGIAQAVKLARPEDTVVITGKGCEQWLMTAEGKVPWDDRQVAREEIKAWLSTN